MTPTVDHSRASTPHVDAMADLLATCIATLDAGEHGVASGLSHLAAALTAGGSAAAEGRAFRDVVTARTGDPAGIAPDAGDPWDAALAIIFALTGQP